MIRSIYFPQSDMVPRHLNELINIFKESQDNIDSYSKDLSSNVVLAILTEYLIGLDYKVEKGKRKEEKLHFSVLHGDNGKVLKAFCPDAYNDKTKTILEVEAGRAVDNNEYIKDLFKALLLPEIDYFALAVRNVYRRKDDFETVKLFYQTVYANRSIHIPLKGILIIGY